MRNRLIAALTRGTVVVEAALRRGALTTARDAERLGRPVLAVPGPVTSAMSRGRPRELRRGATLVTSADDVVEAVGGSASTSPSQPSRAGDRPRRARPASARVLDGVPARRPATVRVRSRARAGVTASEAAAALGLLELAGIVRWVRDGWVLAR